MGGLLSSPELSTEKADGEITRNGLEVKYGVATMQGWRKYQEDTWSVLADDPDWLIFSVFDGHGGTSTSETCRDIFNPFLLGHLKSAGRVTAQLMEHAFMEFDKKLLGMAGGANDKCGCTATILVVDVKSDLLHIAHLGDSRALVFGAETLASGKLLAGDLLYASRDHNPTDPIELDRIQNRARAEVRNGRILSNTRMNSINVCRCFGDGIFKQSRGVRPCDQAVCAVCELHQIGFTSQATAEAAGPAMQTFDLNADNKLCVYLASDGIWNGTIMDVKPGAVAPVMGINDQMQQWCVQHTLAKHGDQYSESIAESFQEIVAPMPQAAHKSTDNMTAIFVTLSGKASAPTKQPVSVSAAAATKAAAAKAAVAAASAEASSATSATARKNKRAWNGRDASADQEVQKTAEPSDSDSGAKHRRKRRKGRDEQSKTGKAKETKKKKKKNRKRRSKK